MRDVGGRKFGWGGAQPLPAIQVIERGSKRPWHLLLPLPPN